MKASELRIGNLLWDKEDNYPITVKSIDESINGFNKTYLDIVQPIPLTEDWLLKFGFSHSQKKYYYNGYFVCKINKAFNCLIYIGNNDYKQLNTVNYVHELQNLYFALVGEELNSINA